MFGGGLGEVHKLRDGGFKAGVGTDGVMQRLDCGLTGLGGLGELGELGGLGQLGEGHELRVGGWTVSKSAE